MKRKLLRFIFSLFILLLPLVLGLSHAKDASAAAWDCSITNPPTITTEDKVINAPFVINTGGQASSSTRYYVYMYSNQISWRVDAATRVNAGNIEITENFDSQGNPGAGNQVFVMPNVTFFVVDVDLGDSIVLDPSALLQKNWCQVDSKMKITVVQGQTGNSENCKIEYPVNTGFFPGEEIIIDLFFPDTDLGRQVKGNPTDPFNVDVTWSGGQKLALIKTSQELDAGTSIGSFGGGVTYRVDVTRDVSPFNRKGCFNTFTIDASGGYIGCRTDEDCKDQAGKFCAADETGKMGCRNFEGGALPEVCGENLGNEENPEFMCKTAVGTFNTDPGKFINNVLALLLSLSGGILLIFLIINGYKLMTSQGDPEKVKDARDAITSTVVGLLFIIFSLVILQFVTVDVLALPGFE